MTPDSASNILAGKYDATGDDVLEDALRSLVALAEENEKLTRLTALLTSDRDAAFAERDRVLAAASAEACDVADAQRRLAESEANRGVLRDVLAELDETMSALVPLATGEYRAFAGFENETAHVGAFRDADAANNPCIDVVRQLLPSETPYYAAVTCAIVGGRSMIAAGKSCATPAAALTALRGSLENMRLLT